MEYGLRSGVSLKVELDYVQIIDWSNLGTLCKNVRLKQLYASGQKAKKLISYIVSYITL